MSLAVAAGRAGSPRAPDASRRGPSRRPISVAATVLALFAVATLVPLVVSLSQTGVSAVAAERQANEQAAAISVTAARQVDDTLRHARSAARVVERLPAFWNGDDAARDAALAALAGAEPAFAVLGYFTPDLQGHGSSNSEPGRPRPSVAGRSYAIEAVRTGRLAVAAEPLGWLGRPDQVILPVAIPVREAAAPGRTGYLVTALHLDHLPDLWEDLPVVSGSTITLVDLRAGGILARSGPTPRAFEEAIPPEDLERIRAGEPTFRVRPPDGVELLRSWSPVAETPWVVTVDVPTDAILRPIYDDALRWAALVAATTLVPLGLLLALWCRMSRQLRALGAAARRWAGGAWGHRSGVRGRDELGQLGETFDAMAGRIQASQAERARQHARREALLRVARRLAGEADAGRLLTELLDEAIALAGAASGALLHWDERDEILVPVRLSEPGGPRPEPIALGEGPIGRAAEGRVPAVGPATWPAGEQTRACLAVPLLNEGRLLGVLAVLAEGPAGRFEADVIEMLELLAGLGGAAVACLERARLNGAILAGRTAQHEVNNALALAAGYAELLTIDPTLPPRLHEAAAEILRGTQEAAASISRLRAVTSLHEKDWGEGTDPTIDLTASVA